MSNEATVSGEVIEVLPNNLYKVSFLEIKNGIGGNVERLAYMGGKMRKNKIRVMIGDKVEVVLDPHGGKTTNRIVRRK